MSTTTGRMVLDFITENNGGGGLVESKRGKLYGAPSYVEIGKSKVNLPTFLS